MRIEKININTKIKLSSKLYASEIADEAVILEKTAGVYYALNQMGVVIYKFLKEAKTIAQLVSLIAEKYDVESTNLENVLQEFVKEMIDANIVKVVE